MRSPKNHSILGVCEDFEGERNEEITLLGNFCDDLMCLQPIVTDACFGGEFDL